MLLLLSLHGNTNNHHRALVNSDFCHRAGSDKSVSLLNLKVNVCSLVAGEAVFGGERKMVIHC